MDYKIYKWIFYWIMVCVCAVEAIESSSCGANFEKVRKRRIEAIRGQILSKLGLTELPNNNYNTTPVPFSTDFEEMYNRKRDFVLEKARQEREECSQPEENYFAQDILVLNTTDPQDGKSEIRSLKAYQSTQTKKQASQFFYFDVASAGMDPDSIVSATLRLYQTPFPGIPHGGRQQVHFYQLSPSETAGLSPQRRFLTMSLMDSFGEGWKSLDVTSVTREWVRVSKLNLGLEVTTNCKDDTTEGLWNLNLQNDQKLQVQFAGSSYDKESQARGDQADQVRFEEDHSPHLIIMFRSSKASHPVSNHRRQKRSLDADYCFRRNPSETNCCLRELFIDFRKDLGWNWIRAPSGYKANYCAGACPYLWSTDTQHSTVLSLYHTMNPQASSAPCCTPKDLDPIVLMYYDRGRFKFTQLPNMVVISCNCN